MNEELDRLTERIIGAAIEVLRVLGPGLLESAYQRALAHALGIQGIPFEQQKSCAVQYKERSVADAYHLDFPVGGLVVVELKTVDVLLEIHEAQILTNLRFTGCRVGLLMNFRSAILAKGLRRLAL